MRKEGRKATSKITVGWNGMDAPAATLTRLTAVTRLNTLGSHHRREVMMAVEVTLPLFNNGLPVWGWERRQRISC